MTTASMLIVLLSPGTEDRAHASALTSLAARLESTLDGPSVRVAFAERAWPTLTATVGRELDRGAVREVLVVPMFLSAGYASTVDVPATVAQAHLDHDVPVRLTAALGTDLSLIPALDRAAPAGRAVVLVPDDTRDGAARERLDRLASAWSAQRGTPVAVGYPTSAPTSSTQVERLTSGRRRPAVVPFTVDTLADSPELAALVAARYRTRVAVSV